MTAELIEPLFREKFADFYLALQVPRSPAEKETPEEAEQCGRYIVNEIARNSSDVFTYYEVSGNGNLWEVFH